MGVFVVVFVVDAVVVVTCDSSPLHPELTYSHVTVRALYRNIKLTIAHDEFVFSIEDGAIVRRAGRSIVTFDVAETENLSRDSINPVHIPIEIQHRNAGRHKRFNVCANHRIIKRGVVAIRRFFL